MILQYAEFIAVGSSLTESAAVENELGANMLTLTVESESTPGVTVEVNTDGDPVNGAWYDATILAGADVAVQAIEDNSVCRVPLDNGVRFVRVKNTDADATLHVYGTFGMSDTTAARDAEAWAVGQRNGVDVPDGDPTYHNNAKYWAEEAEDAGEDAIAAVEAKGQEVIDSIPDDYTELSNDVDTLESKMDAMETATDSDVGLPLKVKTVTGGKVTEWEFGESGQTFFVTGTLNLLDGVNWTAGSLGSSDPVPVEYGKKYTASFSAYANRVFALDASKNELGDTSTDTYIKRTEVFSVWCKKWVYEVMDQSVKYIKFKQMSQPAAPYFLVEGDIDMPYPLDVSTLTATDPSRDNLRKVIFGDEKVGFEDLRADISEGVKKLGYTDKVIESGDVQEYDAETYPLTFDEKGNVVMTDASALRSGTYVMLLKANVNGLYIDKFGYNIDSGAPSGGIAGPPAIVMQTNVGHTGYVLTFRTYGSKIAGISYIYSWNTNGTFTAADSSYAWASDYAIDTLRVKRNSDSFDFIFKDTQGTVTTKHFTFAQMHVTDPDALGIAWIDKKTGAVDNQMVFAGMKVSAPASITGGGTVTSPMNGAKYDAWGDSYTQGTGTYANMIAEQTGATLTNYGVSGNTVAQMYARMQAATVEGEYVSVLCGVNDYLTNTAMATFKTAVTNVCAFIAASYTSAKALWVLPPQLPDNSENTEGNTLEDYVDAIKGICAANSVPVLDMYHAGNWYGTVAAFQTLYFSDSIHPSTAGHALIAGKVRKALEAL